MLSRQSVNMRMFNVQSKAQCTQLSLLHVNINYIL